MLLRLSKSRYCSGLQCLRQLWWRSHEPAAPELVVDDGLQAIFNQGHAVGLAAQERVPGGILIDFPHHAYAEKIMATRSAIESGAPAIYEASVVAADTFVAVDILERVPEGWRLIEVKSTTQVKDQHIPDIAIQLHVLRESGLRVERAELMHLNRDCAFPHLDNLFIREDVTGRAEALLAGIPAEIEKQLHVLHGPIPEVAIGPHCTSPYECPFMGRCWPSRPRHHISELYAIGSGWRQLEAQGYSTIDQLPGGLALRGEAERQRRAVASGTIVVEPGLADALSALREPIAIIDFETLAPAIPIWEGAHPYDPIPAQFSAHVQDGRGGWTHHQWLADGPKDPRPKLVERLAIACEGAATILAYNKSFESRCLSLIAAALPSLKQQTDSIVRRLEDPLPMLRKFVYHPDFGGSFSLKAVLPALVPGLGYDDLEIAEGTAASRALEQLMFDRDALTPEQHAQSRAALLSYCERDTRAVVRLLERLKELA